MKKMTISTDQAPAAIGPYSQVVTVGDFVYTSGQIPVDPKTKQVPEGIEAQAKQAIRNLSAVLKAAGATIDDVVKTTVFLADMDDFAAFNAVYESFFVRDFPARSCVAVAKLPLGVRIEIEAAAVKKAGRQAVYSV